MIHVQRSSFAAKFVAFFVNIYYGYRDVSSDWGITNTCTLAKAILLFIFLLPFRAIQKVAGIQLTRHVTVGILAVVILFVGLSIWIPDVMRVLVFFALFSLVSVGICIAVFTALIYINFVWALWLVEHLNDWGINIVITQRMGLGWTVLIQFGITFLVLTSGWYLRILLGIPVVLLNTIAIAAIIVTIRERQGLDTPRIISLGQATIESIKDKTCRQIVIE